MSLSEEESNFLRFYYLNLKVATKAVRSYFDSVHPPAGLANELAISFVTLNGLRFITKQQLKTLYPSPASNVVSEHFDTTLIVCLLRNMTPRESAPMTGWDHLPQPGDTSIGADLARIKWYRNQLAHDGDGKLSSTDFSQHWRELECAIGRLGGPSLLSEAQSAQHNVLDNSLIDILNSLRNLQLLQMEHTGMVDNLQSAINNQTTIKEEQETRMQQLNDFFQRGEVGAHKLATEISDIKRTIEICIIKIETSRKEIETFQEKVTDKEKRIDDFTLKLLRIECKYDINFKEIDVRLKKQDGELAKQGAYMTKQDEQMTKQYEQMTKQDEQMTKQGEQMTKQGEQMTKQDEQITKQGEQMTKQGEQMTKQYETLAKQTEQMAKQEERISQQDEMMAACVKDIDNIKITQYDSDYSSEGRKRKRLEDDTKALIGEDIREDTFVITKAVEDGLLLLKQNGVLLLTGHAGTGKSRTGRHILHMYCTDNISYKCIKLNALDEWEDIVSREHNVVVLLDDIFGETNCIYNREKDTPILEKVYAYVCRGNIKVIITIRDTVKRRCQEVFDSHRLFQFRFIDLSSDSYKLILQEKSAFLEKYMKKVRQLDHAFGGGFVDCNGVTILNTNDVLRITEENPVKGFPLAVYQFVHNEKYFQLGSQFFDRPTEAMLEELNDIRRKGRDNNSFMMHYAVMVYTAINGNCINPQDSSVVIEVTNIINAIYGKTITLNNCHISDTVNELKGSYLVLIANTRSYRFHHPTLQEGVILSFAQIDGEQIKNIIPLLSWSFILKMVKSDAYVEKDGEVVLKIPRNSEKLLAYRLVDIYLTTIRESRSEIYWFLAEIIDTEIFQQKAYILLTYLLQGFEDIKHEHLKSCLKSIKYLLKSMFYEVDSCDEHMISTTVFLSNLLVSIAKTES